MSFIPPIDIQNHKQALMPLLRYLLTLSNPQEDDLKHALSRFPKKDGYFRKTDIYEAFRVLSVSDGIGLPSKALKQLLKVKPIRTLSGVTPVTVLTKPYPCPGECIFCPSDIRMPKSYLSLEPGAQRAANNHFDPYLQTYNRLSAFRAMGHVYNKAELLVLGGTWSVYPLSYRIWFIKRLFEALNDFGEGIDQQEVIRKQQYISLPPLEAGLGQVPVDTGKFATYNQAIKAAYPSLQHPFEVSSWEDLQVEQKRNETALVRCVGLVLETRPDFVTPNEALVLRQLGATKIQIGLQSTNDSILTKNKRGHTAKTTAKALALLRSFGFKLHVHWMPNLLSATPEKDKADYLNLFENPSYRPDEIKIYPCSLIEGTELMREYQAGKWQPYSHEELMDVVSFALVNTPRYCRITRVVRDIPSSDIVVGNKYTNFRQLAENTVKAAGGVVIDIRSREIKNRKIDPSTIQLKQTSYTSSVGEEYFLEWTTTDDSIIAFLRLLLPTSWSSGMPVELKHAAIIREVHVYGETIKVGDQKEKAAQHLGLGKQLIKKAITLATKAGYQKLSVISAVGTREYYRKQGFHDGEWYQHYPI